MINPQPHHFFHNIIFPSPIAHLTKKNYICA